MKKLISCLLALSLVLTSFGALTAFADDAQYSAYTVGENTFFENFSGITSQPDRTNGQTAGVNLNNVTGSHYYTTATTSSYAGWAYQECSDLNALEAGYYKQWIEGGVDSLANGNHEDLTLEYDGEFAGNTLEIVTGMASVHNISENGETHEVNAVYDNAPANIQALTAAEIAEYVDHFDLGVTIGGVDVTSNLIVEQIGYHRSDIPIIRYKINNIGSGDIVITANGDYHHKIYSIEVKEPDTVLTSFVDNFSEIERVVESCTPSTIPHNAKFVKSSKLWLWNRTNVTGTAYGSDYIGRVEGQRDGSDTTSVTYKGEFGGLRARFALAGDANSMDGIYQAAYRDTYPCSNVIWSKWDVIREYYDLENKIHIYAGTSEGNLTEVPVLYWEGSSLQGFIPFAANTAALPAGTTYLKFELADISNWVWKILSCSALEDVVNASAVTVVDGNGYLDGANVYYDFNDNTMDINRNINLNAFPFINSFINTNANNYGIYVKNGDARKTTGVKVKVDKANRNAAGMISVLAEGTTDEKAAYTTDTARGLYGILVGHTVEAGDTVYEATYHLTNLDKDVVRSFDCSGLAGAVNFGLTFNNVPEDETITFVEN